jgi:hypothetical protein
MKIIGLILVGLVLVMLIFFYNYELIIINSEELVRKLLFLLIVLLLALKILWKILTTSDFTKFDYDKFNLIKNKNNYYEQKRSI